MRQHGFLVCLDSICTLMTLKAGTHYPFVRPVSTAHAYGCLLAPVRVGRRDGPSRTSIVVQCFSVERPVRTASAYRQRQPFTRPVQFQKPMKNATYLFILRYIALVEAVFVHTRHRLMYSALSSRSSSRTKVSVKPLSSLRI